MSPPKVVATDLDGTLLRSDLTVSPRTRAVLARIEEAGALLVFVTGRPPRWIHPVSDQTDHRGIAVCANGALLYDLHTEEVVGEFPIAVETLAEVVAAMRDALPGLSFAVEYGKNFVHEQNFPVQERHRRPELRLVEFAELLGQPAAKLVVRHPELRSGELLDALTPHATGVTLTHSMPHGPGLLEISAAGVTKASGLARLCEEHGIDTADVVAFGDMPNDLPMLAWAGRPYAMSNGHPEVRAAVANHAPPNDEDGVAQVLEQWF